MRNVRRPLFPLAVSFIALIATVSNTQPIEYKDSDYLAMVYLATFSPKSVPEEYDGVTVLSEHSSTKTVVANTLVNDALWLTLWR